ncbi:MAG: UPF0176 protein [Bacteroidia bacterium]|jgi:UPF0176 protein
MQLHNKINREELKQQLAESTEPRVTISFYQYAKIGNPQVFRDFLFLEWEKLGIFGRIYVAEEGINAQISVPNESFTSFQESLGQITFLENVRLNIAFEDDGKSFFKLKIQVKKKIVADGLNDETFDSSKIGTHLSAEAFNQLAEDPNTVIVDMRNHYETEVGHFENAICPDVDTFREALPIVEEILEPHKDKNIVMYCTGGIRCEKASAYYKHKGFENVFQLEGGIIKYAKDAKANGLENKFRGKNFVFDERLGERISDEIISECHQCGKPFDSHTNCGNKACNLLFLQCEECAEKLDGCCSTSCQEIHALPEEEQKELRRGQDSKVRIFSKGRFETE